MFLLIRAGKSQDESSYGQTVQEVFMNKHSSIGEKPEALKKMEKNDPHKYRSVSGHIAAMVKSLDEQEKNSSSAPEAEDDQD